MKWDYTHLQYFGTFAFISCCNLDVQRWEQIESSGPNTAPSGLLCAGCCTNIKALTVLPASVNLPSTKETRDCGTAQSGEVRIYKCSANSVVLWFCSKMQHLFIGVLLILNIEFKQKVWMIQSPETQWKMPGVFNRHFITPSLDDSRVMCVKCICWNTKTLSCFCATCFQYETLCLVPA